MTKASVRFGSFEVDFRAGELHKSGVKIKLQGEPPALLAFLLERPGQVVTREELQQKLWAGDTLSVDFEHGLNKAIGKAREALADEADNPRFIANLPRRGYRFIAPVGVRAPGLVPRHQGDTQRLPPRAQTNVGEAVREPALQRHRVLGLRVAAIIVIAALSYWLTRPLMPPKVSSYTRITNDGRAKRFRIDALPVIVTDGLRLYFAEAAQGVTQSLTSVNGSPGRAGSRMCLLNNPVSRDATLHSAFCLGPTRFASGLRRLL